MFYIVKKSTAVSVALLSAVAATGFPDQIVHAQSARISVAPAMIERGGFGAIIGDGCLLGAFVAATVLISRSVGGE